MQIDKLAIENFQLFDQQEFEFHPNFNLVVGVNGSGKTSLLRAVAVALGGWAHAYVQDEHNQRPIDQREIREVQIDERFDPMPSSSIAAEGQGTIIDRALEEKVGKLKWTRTRTEAKPVTTTSGTIEYAGYAKEYALSFTTLGNDTLRFIEEGGKYGLPLFAFYECDRIWKSDQSINPSDSAQTRYSRFDAYRDCFHTGANHKQLAEWVLKNELASLQAKQDTPVLQSIRRAAQIALEGCTGLRFNFIEGRVLVEFEGGKVIPFDHLSDGQRTMLGLFCDLARRAAILNPHHGGDASQKTRGVVLIDELDLHLHPRWQRMIIANLRKLFPQMQFICTTHSPFLIQAIDDGKLIMLDQHTADNPKNKSIEDIIEAIQGIPVPQRSQRFQDMMHAAEQYFSVLHQAMPEDDAQLMALKAELDRLSAPFSEDAAYQALLNVERLSILGDKNP